MPQTPPFSAMFDSSGYNRNLYQSAEDSCGGLYYHDNNLLSGSLEALIQHLVPNVDYYPDRTYIFTFLLSSRLFMHPYELMAKVCHLCVEHQRLSDPDSDKNQMRKIAPKVLQLLTEWTETFPYDFRDERMMRNLKDLAHRIASGEEVGNLNLARLLEFPGRAWVRNGAKLCILISTASCLFCLWASPPHHILVCLVCQVGMIIPSHFKGI
ncbi:RASGEF1B isoform 8 [Pongo abelii]|uniref:RASGEF1B isoform 7 n=1 Tax=Pongo abelii TaxID=9601 RepID=A0A2J8UUI5_PONAB|nr:RASGEF1B isoform 7 [Pongo abelii]PNJ48939.1 RASGEF1B isoform 8 [Pongo abelii]